MEPVEALEVVLEAEVRFGVDLWKEDLFDLKVEGVLDEVTLAIEDLADSTDLCTRLLGGDRAKLPTLVLEAVVVVEAAVFPVAVLEVVFLLIILFGDVRRCKNGLFCTVEAVGLLSILSEAAATVE